MMCKRTVIILTIILFLVVVVFIVALFKKDVFVTRKEALTVEDCLLDGLYPDATNCSRFYMCAAFGPVLFQCPAGLHFNPTLNYCDWPEKAECILPAASGALSTQGYKPVTNPEEQPHSTTNSKILNENTTEPYNSTLIIDKSTIIATTIVPQENEQTFNPDPVSNLDNFTTVSYTATPNSLVSETVITNDLPFSTVPIFTEITTETIKNNVTENISTTMEVSRIPDDQMSDKDGIFSTITTFMETSTSLFSEKVSTTNDFSQTNILDNQTDSPELSISFVSNVPTIDRYNSVAPELITESSTLSDNDRVITSEALPSEKPSNAISIDTSSTISVSTSSSSEGVMIDNDISTESSITHNKPKITYVTTMATSELTEQAETILNTILPVIPTSVVYEDIGGTTASPDFIDISVRTSPKVEQNIVENSTAIWVLSSSDTKTSSVNRSVINEESTLTSITNSEGKDDSFVNISNKTTIDSNSAAFVSKDDFNSTPIEITLSISTEYQKPTTTSAPEIEASTAHIYTTRQDLISEASTDPFYNPASTATNSFKIPNTSPNHGTHTSQYSTLIISNSSSMVTEKVPPESTTMLKTEIPTKIPTIAEIDVSTNNKTTESGLIIDQEITEDINITSNSIAEDSIISLEATSVDTQDKITPTVVTNLLMNITETVEVVMSTTNSNSNIKSSTEKESLIPNSSILSGNSKDLTSTEIPGNTIALETNVTWAQTDGTYNKKFTIEVNTETVMAEILTSSGILEKESSTTKDFPNPTTTNGSISDGISDVESPTEKETSKPIPNNYTVLTELEDEHVSLTTKLTDIPTDTRLDTKTTTEAIVSTHITTPETRVSTNYAIADTESSSDMYYGTKTTEAKSSTNNGISETDNDNPKLISTVLPAKSSNSTTIGLLNEVVSLETTMNARTDMPDNAKSTTETKVATQIIVAETEVSANDETPGAETNEIKNHILISTTPSDNLFVTTPSEIPDSISLEVQTTDNQTDIPHNTKVTPVTTNEKISDILPTEEEIRVTSFEIPKLSTTESPIHNSTVETSIELSKVPVPINKELTSIQTDVPYSTKAWTEINVTYLESELTTNGKITNSPTEKEIPKLTTNPFSEDYTILTSSELSGKPVSLETKPTDILTHITTSEIKVSISDGMSHAESSTDNDIIKLISTKIPTLAEIDKTTQTDSTIVKEITKEENITSTNLENNTISLETTSTDTNNKITSTVEADIPTNIITTTVEMVMSTSAGDSDVNSSTGKQDSKLNSSILSDNSKDLTTTELPGNTIALATNVTWAQTDVTYNKKSTIEVNTQTMIPVMTDREILTSSGILETESSTTKDILNTLTTINVSINDGISDVESPIEKETPKPTSNNYTVSTELEDEHVSLVTTVTDIPKDIRLSTKSTTDAILSTHVTTPENKIFTNYTIVDAESSSNMYHATKTTEKFSTNNRISETELLTDNPKLISTVLPEKSTNSTTIGLLNDVVSLETTMNARTDMPDNAKSTTETKVATQIIVAETEVSANDETPGAETSNEIKNHILISTTTSDNLFVTTLSELPGSISLAVQTTDNQTDIPHNTKVTPVATNEKISDISPTEEEIHVTSSEIPKLSTTESPIHNSTVETSIELSKVPVPANKELTSIQTDVPYSTKAWTEINVTYLESEVTTNGKITNAPIEKEIPKLTTNPFSEDYTILTSSEVSGKHVSLETKPTDILTHIITSEIKVSTNDGISHAESSTDNDIIKLISTKIPTLAEIDKTTQTDSTIVKEITKEENITSTNLENNTISLETTSTDTNNKITSTVEADIPTNIITTTVEMVMSTSAGDSDVNSSTGKQNSKLNSSILSDNSKDLTTTELPGNTIALATNVTWAQTDVTYNKKSTIEVNTQTMIPVMTEREILTSSGILEKESSTTKDILNTLTTINVSINDGISDVESPIEKETPKPTSNNYTVSTELEDEHVSLVTTVTDIPKDIRLSTKSTTDAILSTHVTTPENKIFTNYTIVEAKSSSNMYHATKTTEKFSTNNRISETELLTDNPKLISTVLPEKSTNSTRIGLLNEAVSLETTMNARTDMPYNAKSTTETKVATQIIVAETEVSANDETPGAETSNEIKNHILISTTPSDNLFVTTPSEIPGSISLAVQTTDNQTDIPHNTKVTPVATNEKISDISPTEEEIHVTSSEIPKLSTTESPIHNSTVETSIELSKVPVPANKELTSIQTDVPYSTKAWTEINVTYLESEVTTNGEITNGPIEKEIPKLTTNPFSEDYTILTSSELSGKPVSLETKPTDILTHITTSEINVSTNDLISHAESSTDNDIIKLISTKIPTLAEIDKTTQTDSTIVKEITEEGNITSTDLKNNTISLETYIPTNIITTTVEMVMPTSAGNSGVNSSTGKQNSTLNSSILSDNSKDLTSTELPGNTIALETNVTWAQTDATNNEKSTIKAITPTMHIMAVTEIPDLTTTKVLINNGISDVETSTEKETPSNKYTVLTVLEDDHVSLTTKLTDIPTDIHLSTKSTTDAILSTDITTPATKVSTNYAISDKEASSDMYHGTKTAEENTTTESSNENEIPKLTSSASTDIFASIGSSELPHHLVSLVTQTTDTKTDMPSSTKSTQAHVPNKKTTLAEMKVTNEGNSDKKSPTKVSELPVDKSSIGTSSELPGIFVSSHSSNTGDQREMSYITKSSIETNTPITLTISTKITTNDGISDVKSSTHKAEPSNSIILTSTDIPDKMTAAFVSLETKVSDIEKEIPYNTTPTTEANVPTNINVIPEIHVSTIPKLISTLLPDNIPLASTSLTNSYVSSNTKTTYSQQHIDSAKSSTEYLPTDSVNTEITTKYENVGSTTESAFSKLTSTILPDNNIALASTEIGSLLTETEDLFNTKPTQEINIPLNTTSASNTNILISGATSDLESSTEKYIRLTSTAPDNDIILTSKEVPTIITSLSVKPNTNLYDTKTDTPYITISTTELNVPMKISTMAETSISNKSVTTPATEVVSESTWKDKPILPNEPSIQTTTKKELTEDILTHSTTPISTENSKSNEINDNRDNDKNNVSFDYSSHETDESEVINKGDENDSNENTSVEDGDNIDNDNNYDEGDVQNTSKEIYNHYVKESDEDSVENKSSENSREDRNRHHKKHSEQKSSREDNDDKIEHGRDHDRHNKNSSREQKIRENNSDESRSKENRNSKEKNSEESNVDNRDHHHKKNSEENSSKEDKHNRNNRKPKQDSNNENRLKHNRHSKEENSKESDHYNSEEIISKEEGHNRNNHKHQHDNNNENRRRRNRNQSEDSSKELTSRASRDSHKNRSKNRDRGESLDKSKEKYGDAGYSSKNKNNLKTVDLETIYKDIRKFRQTLKIF